MVSSAISRGVLGLLSLGRESADFIAAHLDSLCELSCLCDGDVRLAAYLLVEGDERYPDSVGKTLLSNVQLRNSAATSP